jgi:3,4-dihydroxy 2-butanone 4-phosphate synthase/GTP cyclohydrolase II
MKGFDSIKSALKDLKNGKMVVVVDGDDRENEGDILLAAEKATPEKLNFIIKEARGLLCVPITQKKADQLGLPKMTWQNDKFNTPFTVSVDAASCGTGISVQDRLLTIKKILSEKSKPESLRRPGHLFPLVAQDAGVLARPGHTEAAVDLLLLANLKPVGVISEIMNDDGSMARLPELKKFAKLHNLKLISIRDLIDYKISAGKNILECGHAKLPTKFGNFEAIGFRDSLANEIYLVVKKGDLKKGKSPLVRIHSACITGDVFHSLRCDCNDQLHAALKKIERNGNGLVIYVPHHEGRGAGLLNKLKAYELQEKGRDTVDANLELGLEIDSRDFGPSAQILLHLGIKKIRLMSNNPVKKLNLEAYGIKITEVVPLKVKPNKYNKFYLETKKLKLGHFL